jgi:hypothetical protein
VLQHHLVALDLRVEPRKRAQRADRCLGEERGDAKADAVPLLERLLVALAQRHHRGHVDFVEGAEHRGGALRFHEPLGDGGAPLRHPHAFLGPLARGHRTLRYGRDGPPLRGLRRPVGRFRRSRGGGRRRRLRRTLHVALHHAAGVAGALHTRQIDVVLLRRLPGGRRRARLAGFRVSRSGSCGRGGRGRLSRFVDDAEDLADLHVLTVLPIDAAQHSG